MMTMHSAKGLEFPHVFLVGFEDGLFPGMRAIGDKEEMEEERRLCYVAITRAKKNLTISHARQRMLYGRTNGAMASRFLREIPESCIVRKGGFRPRAETAAKEPWEYSQVPAQRRTNPYRKPEIPVATKPAPAILELNKGDMVLHAAFRRGLVLSVM
jgi:DNA helicase-2/ATP-dependent DNA helicase PcrA